MHADSPAIREFLSQPENRVIFERERLVGDWLEIIQEAMDRSGQTRADIAGLLGCSRAFVSKTLRAPSNIEVDTLVRVGLAAGISFSIAGCQADALLLPEGYQARIASTPADQDAGTVAVGTYPLAA